MRGMCSRVPTSTEEVPSTGMTFTMLTIRHILTPLPRHLLEELPRHGKRSLVVILRSLTCYRLCHVHNQVNARLGKPEFDCANLDATYDCWCGDEPVFGAKKSVTSDPMDLEVDSSKDRITGVGMIQGGR